MNIITMMSINNFGFDDDDDGDDDLNHDDVI